MAGIAWVNGELMPPDEPAISPLDRGFLYGEGLFETMRAYRGRVFRLADHLDRLITAAGELDFTPPSADALGNAVEEAVDAGGIKDATVRLTVTPGLAALADPTVVVLVRPLSLPSEEIYELGCRAAAIPAVEIPETPLRRVKSLNYLDKLLAQQAARRKECHEAILVDADGCVVEGAMRNVFAAFGGELVTPPLSRCLLPGITRATVIEIARADGIPVAERDVGLTRLYDADEAFFTSSIAEIIPIASVDDNRLRESPGLLTASLTKKYRSLASS